MRAGGRVVKLGAADVRRLVREVASSARRGTVRESAASAKIDWESPEGIALTEAIDALTFAVIECFVEDDEEFDGYVPEVSNDIRRKVEEIAEQYDWAGGAGDVD